MDRSKTVETIRQRLRALGCPFSEDPNILCNSYSFLELIAKQVIVNIVSWLEDQHIRLFLFFTSFDD